MMVAQGRKVAPGPRDLVGFGKLAITPPWEIWRLVIQVAD